MSHKATDVGEITQGENMLGERRPGPSFLHHQHLIADEQRRCWGKRRKTRTKVAKEEPRRESLQERNEGQCPIAPSAQGEGVSKTPSEKAAH